MLSNGLYRFVTNWSQTVHINWRKVLSRFFVEVLKNQNCASLYGWLFRGAAGEMTQVSLSGAGYPWSNKSCQEVRFIKNFVDLQLWCLNQVKVCAKSPSCTVKTSPVPIVALPDYGSLINCTGVWDELTRVCEHAVWASRLTKCFSWKIGGS